MKKGITYLSFLLFMGSCAQDSLVETTGPELTLRQKTISFSAAKSNLTRASKLQEYGHLNFGVFGYKSTDDVHPVIENYLVGYNDTANHRGYYMTLETQTTLGDWEEIVDGKSFWAYEHLGSADYTYIGSDGYVQATETAMMSNHANQVLRFWDLEAPTTTFYAYAPYVNGAGTGTFDNATKQLSLPEGTLSDGYDQPTSCEYMYAATTVAKDDYGKDVWLLFRRLNAKVNIKFYEEIDGYSIQMIDLLPGKYDDVQATPAIENEGKYTAGEYFSNTGVNIDFSTSVSNPQVTHVSSVKEANTRPLVFKEPVEEAIGVTRETASASPTTYYAIPKNNTTGFTFHVSFVLTSTTGEKITVKNATVFVPSDHCNWQANHAYTYIFKITKNTSGSTDPEKDDTIDPTDPTVDPEIALYPIVFDAAKVDDWTLEESEYEINHTSVN